jgi:hypothetical protein
VARFAFQACSFNYSDISPFRINDLRAAQNGVAQNPPSRTSDLRCRVVPIVWRHTRSCTKRNCVRPSNLPRPFTAIWLSRRRFERDADLQRVRALGTEEIDSRLVIGDDHVLLSLSGRAGRPELMQICFGMHVVPVRGVFVRIRQRENR